jgi:hypothetical protein
MMPPAAADQADFKLVNRKTNESRVLDLDRDARRDAEEDGHIQRLRAAAPESAAKHVAAASPS